jgi:hypothetical protein
VPILFRCPSCGKSLKVSSRHAGRASKCPGCGQALVVPNATHQPEEPPAPPTRRSGRRAVPPDDSRIDWSGPEWPVVRKGLFLVRAAWMLAASLMPLTICCGISLGVLLSNRGSQASESAIAWLIMIMAVELLLVSVLATLGRWYFCRIPPHLQPGTLPRAAAFVTAAAAAVFVLSFLLSVMSRVLINFFRWNGEDTAHTVASGSSVVMLLGLLVLLAAEILFLIPMRQLTDKARMSRAAANLNYQFILLLVLAGLALLDSCMLVTFSAVLDDASDATTALATLLAATFTLLVQGVIETYLILCIVFFGKLIHTIQARIYAAE